MALDPRAFEDALAAWLAPLLGAPPAATELRGVSIDGKTPRGTQALDRLQTMLVAALDHQTGAVLRQLAVPSGTNEQKTALDWLRQLVLTGRVITADALHCQQETCQLITDSGGHYVITVKDNQPTLEAAIASEFRAQDAAFPPSQQRQRQAERRASTQSDKGHGRRERRVIETSTALQEHLARLGWSGVRQVFRLVRQRQQRDPETGGLQTTRETVYGITSLSRNQADAAEVAAYVRAHWKIENQLHYVRDVTFREDACRIRTGHGPQQLATARNTAIALCRLNNHPHLAAARREFAWNPQRLFTILGWVKK